MALWTKKWVLWRFILCSLLVVGAFSVCIQGVTADEQEGPSESQCRPYIEKALKNLEAGDSHSGSQEEKDDSGEAVEAASNEDTNEQIDDDGGSVETSDDASTGDGGSSEEGEDSPSLEVADEPYVDEVIVESDDAEAPKPDDSGENDSQEEGDEPAEQSSAEDVDSKEAAQDDGDSNEASAEDENSEDAEKKDESVEEKDGADESDENKSGEAEDADGESQEATDEQESTEEVADDSKEDDAATEEDASQEQADEADVSGEQADESADESNEEGDAKDEVDESGEQSDSKEGDSKEQDDSKEETDDSKEAGQDQKDDSQEQTDDSKEGDDSKEQADDSKEETDDSKDQSDDSKEQLDDSKEQDDDSQEESDDSKEKTVDSKEQVDDSKEQVDDSKEEQDDDSKEGEESKEGTDESKEQDDSKEASDKDDSEVDSEEKAESPEESDDSKEKDESKGDDSKEEVEEEQEKSEVQGDDAEAPSEDDAESDESQEGEEAEAETPEDDLLLEIEIPENLRSREHIDQLLRLDEESTETELLMEKSADIVLRELKKLYDNAIKPLEILYKYRDLSNRHFGDPEIFSKPLVLFMGPWSGGKSSLINYLTDNEFTEWSLRTGAEPSPAYFNILMHGEEPQVLDGTQLAADWTFSGLQKFGQGLEERLRGLKLPNKLLERVNIVEIPGILEVRKQVSRVFPFNDACQWFIDRADIIFLVYDPSKLDVGPETEAILDQLKGRESQTRIILNKADQVKPEELMRVQSALIWNISPLMSSAQPPVMYTTSLWSIPYESGSPARLLQSQEKSFLRDLREAMDKRIENKISSARRFAVRVRNHAKMVDCYLTTYYNHKTIFGNRKVVAEAIIEHPQNYHIYEGLSTLTNISRYDLPDPETYRDFFRLNPLYEFQQLSATCTYFRGCPINRLDVAIAYDLPELVGKYKKMVETATPQGMPKS